MSAIHPGYTVEDLERQRKNSDLRHEVIAGAIVGTSAPAHNFRVGEPCSGIRVRLHANAAGRAAFPPVVVHLAGAVMGESDILVMRTDRLGQFGTRHISGAPSLVVDVNPPSSRHTDSVDERFVTAMAGVPENWLVDPERGAVVRQSVPENGETRGAHIFGRDEQMSVATRIDCRSGGGVRGTRPQCDRPAG